MLESRYSGRPLRIVFISTSEIPFDVATPERRPLGGTESAICYLARALAKRGHEVLLSRPGMATDRIQGVTHQDLLRTGPNYFQDHDAAIVVCSAAHIPAVRAHFIPPHVPLYYWTPHAPNQPAVAALGMPEVLAQLSAIVFVSVWQERAYQQAFALQENKLYVIGNGLTPAFENLFSSSRELMASKPGQTCCYTSTPFRGLDLLAEVARHFHIPATFEVFSSMRVYDADDSPYQPLYDAIQATPNMRLRDSVAQNELAAALRGMAFFTYPSTFAETFCIATLEALAAGMEVISTSLGALPETTLGLATLIPPPRDQREVVAFLHNYTRVLESAMQRREANPELWAEQRWEQVRKVMDSATWQHRASEWERLIASKCGIDES